jgi:transcriptional regulator with XRE-family HTH domain
MIMAKEKHYRLKQARKDKGLTLKALSEAISGKLSTSAIANYESGIRELKVPQAVILANGLDVSAAFLVGLVGPDEDLLMDLLIEVSMRGDYDVKRVTSIVRAYLDN